MIERVLMFISLISNLMVWSPRELIIFCSSIHSNKNHSSIDHELARYLLENRPDLRKFGQPEIVKQLTQARQRSTSKTVDSATRTPVASVNCLESTVAEVLAALAGTG